MFEKEDIDGVAVLRMAHGKANAMDLEFCAGLIEVLNELEGREGGAVVLTGSGKIFSAGVDLFRVLKEDTEYLDAFYPALANAFARVFAFKGPIVAAINGHAIAGGCVLACCCDYRIMAGGDGTVGVPELRVGVPFPTVAMEILRFAVGNAHLQALVLSGDTVSADEARRLGMVDELVDAGALLERAVARARSLAAVPPRVYGLSKRQLREPALTRIDAQSRVDDEAVRAVWMDPKTLDHMREYLEKTVGIKNR
jgi:enoyl-CoA hydratase